MSDVDKPSQACWCGNDRLAAFGPDYLKCEACQTLVAVRDPARDVTTVGSDERGFYGKEYWFAHQQRDGRLPDIRARARADLPERCVHWLRMVLKYKLPPARVQELGSAHGGFVALLRQAGFDATGLELSPWIADFARETFGVPMLQGPVEAQALAPASLDALVLMDVLEHMPDPVGTLSRGLGLLEPGGVAVVQTPAYPDGTTYEQLVARDDYFLNHVRGMRDEHLFLFSRPAAQELFRRLGWPAVTFEPAIFPQYDMFFVAAREALPTHSAEAVDAALTATPGGRMALALLDAAARRDYYLGEATARMAVIDGLAKEVERLRRE